MMKMLLHSVFVLALCAAYSKEANGAGVARNDRDYPYTVDTETGVQIGMTGREMDRSVARDMAILGATKPGAALLWKQVNREPGQYVGMYVYPNDHMVKVYGSTEFVVLLKNGKVIRSKAWYLTDDGETQAQLWKSEDVGEAGLKLNPAWMLSTKKGSIVFAALYPLGSFRLSDIKEVAVKHIRVDDDYIDIASSPALLTKDTNRR